MIGNRKIGLHVRLNDSLADAARKAVRLGVDFFQCFLVLQHANRLINPDSDEIREFIDVCTAHHLPFIVHGSYWINPAGILQNGYRALQRELSLAKKLGCGRIVLHPGSAKGAQDRHQGIIAVATFLNRLFKYDSEVTVILENTAHAKMSVGSDIKDFKAIKGLLDSPERIRFCLDTSHAYTYGYDISTNAGRAEFLDLVADSIGFDAIDLIHLNDAKYRCGSLIDTHEIPGKGLIGLEALHQFVHDSRLVDIPMLMELPELDETEETAALELIRGWNI